MGGWLVGWLAGWLDFAVAIGVAVIALVVGAFMKDKPPESNFSRLSQNIVHNDIWDGSAKRIFYEIEVNWNRQHSLEFAEDFCKAEFQWINSVASVYSLDFLNIDIDNRLNVVAVNIQLQGSDAELFVDQIHRERNVCATT